MNLREITKVIGMASSGEMQGFIAKFQAELDALTADRMALRMAFPKAYLHFNARFDALDKKVDILLATLATPPMEQPNAIDPGNAEHNGVNYGHTDHNGTNPVHGTNRQE